MTPEAQRIAIAQACGRPIYRFCGDEDSAHEPYEDPQATKHLPENIRDVDVLIRCRKCDGYRWRSTRAWQPHGDADEFPDYLNSLDAMNEAEKVLTEDQQDTYWCELRHIVDAGLDEMQHCFNSAHATAAQRAEAFLKALTLWTP